ncbi:sulfotransferase family protein [uncultured Umboniibacter sp.]|uniref:tetratricopeptide repeat-containing sulfotransferase family protein n=1 Tax=uncultured Umboniibacter sp. TaxID=1798917 RepID=UPI0026158C28|nr:sulfotransferase family protein [uncultured Umboniibacter sp.]
MNPKLAEWLKAGLKAQQLGQVDQAIKLFKKVLNKDASNVPALNLLGVAELGQGRAESAAKNIEKALRYREADPQAHGNIGLAYRELGQAELAEQHFKRSLSLNGRNPVVLNNLANLLTELQRPGEAIPLFDRALAEAPQYAEAWTNLGSALLMTGQHKEAAIACDRALRLDANIAQALNTRAEIARHFANFNQAILDYRAAIKIHPHYTDAHINLANVLRESEQPKQAQLVLEKVLEFSPNNPQALTSLGVLAEQLGDLTLAAEYFLRAIDEAPNNVMSHYQLAQLKGRRSSLEEIEEMKRLWNLDGIPEQERMHLGFGLFKALEQQGEYDEAFSFLAAGNKINAQHNPYDDVQAERYLDSLLSESAACSVNVEDSLKDSPQLVFVLGMPRSGTTLTEQILASHSDVFGAGEVSYAYDVARDVENLTGATYPAGVQSLKADQLSSLAKAYLVRFSEEALANKVIVDKTPLNFQYIGLLARIFPSAKFINCIREPMDNCFSIFKLPFGDSQSYAHSLQSLGQYYRRYEHLMAGWQQQFPGRVYACEYEATVADLETQAKHLLDFIDLEFEAEVLDFHASKRLVRTPSASQVRQPIYQSSVAAWKRYSEQLAPLKQALGLR